MVSVWVQIISLFLCQMFSVEGVTPRCSSLQGDDKAVLSSCNFTRCMWEFHALNKIVLWISFCGRCLWMKGALILMIRHGCMQIAFDCVRGLPGVSLLSICRHLYLHHVFLLHSLPSASIYLSISIDWQKLLGLFYQTLLDFSIQSWLAVLELSDFHIVYLCAGL